MDLNDYKVILYGNQPDGWVAEIPAIEGCYALMPTGQQALAELDQVFDMIAAEYRDKGLSMPADTTEIVNAWQERGVNQSDTGLRSDQTVLPTSVTTQYDYPVAVRRATYRGLVSGKRFILLTPTCWWPLPGRRLV